MLSNVDHFVFHSNFAALFCATWCHYMYVVVVAAPDGSFASGREFFFVDIER